MAIQCNFRRGGPAGQYILAKIQGRAGRLGFDVGYWEVHVWQSQDPCRTGLGQVLGRVGRAGPEQCMTLEDDASIRVEASQLV